MCHRMMTHDAPSPRDGIFWRKMTPTERSSIMLKHNEDMYPDPRNYVTVTEDESSNCQCGKMTYHNPYNVLWP